VVVRFDLRQDSPRPFVDNGLNVDGRWGRLRPVNNIEQAVFTSTDQQSEADKEFCGCQKCRADVAAVALAGLEPLYSTSENGYEMAREMIDHPSTRARIAAKVSEALDRVKGRPRH
jgi:competence protein ComFB